MFKQLPIKKEYLLIAAGVLLLLLSYKLAFKETLNAWRVNRELKAQIAQNNNLNYQPLYLARKNKNLDKLIELYKADTVSYRNSSISTISILAEKENVKLIEAPLQDPLYQTNNFIIQKLDFEGSFFALTKVLQQLQHTRGIGIIRSLSYKLTGNDDKTRKLILEIYLEIAR